MNPELNLGFQERVVFGLRALYNRHGYAQYKMSKFEEYDLYARNKDFLISDSAITFDPIAFNTPGMKYLVVKENASDLGGITVDLTKDEVYEINKQVWRAHTSAQKYGVDDSYLPLNELFDYGEGVQLDGRQTLAYARIRKLDNDYARAGRQRETLGKLASKLKEKSPAEITMMLASFTQYVKTNMEFNEAASIAMKVLQGDMNNIEGFRLPVEKTYEAKTVNNKSMLYDCDWAVNARDLYTFIYS